MKYELLLGVKVTIISHDYLGTIFLGDNKIMRELRNFKSGGNSGSTGGGADNVTQANTIYKDAMAKYGGMEEDALIEQLVTQITTSKQKGTYNATQMNAYIQMLKPHLTDKQRSKLDNVMRVIDIQG